MRNKMKLIIDIPDKVYGLFKYFEPAIKTEDYKGNTVRDVLVRAIINGTLLPKGHGDLYDCNDLDKLVGEDFRFFLSRLDLKSPQPIIKADKRESE